MLSAGIIKHSYLRKTAEAFNLKGKQGTESGVFKETRVNPKRKKRECQEKGKLLNVTLFTQIHKWENNNIRDLLSNATTDMFFNNVYQLLYMFIIPLKGFTLIL